ncbi:LysE family translocator [Thalassospira tepidiphila]|uniref:Lysine transporter LysE n=2 Tax=Thalassospira tepidiphila TaxID=393657 RepID=A0A853L183_9PROT|nr:LysE family translocator [Thalassospira tepidiphila]NJB73545.1 threonine/homoserine/homoserine lactone efflux protein [Thalassospira tepidiphila]OAZ10752.1 lysine transporter LysE [Thalassospira tepidiphila MCCC 1A03514]
MIELLVAYTPFLIAALLLNISPGPDMAYIVGQTAVHGRKIGLFSSLGVISGAFVHVLAATFGLSAILATSALAFAIVKWIGVAYLVWLGIGALRSSFAKSETAAQSAEPAAPISTKPMTAFGAWRQGVMIDVLNPKVAIFFMAFLPQFIDPRRGNGAVQFLVLGLMVLLIAFVVEGMLVLAVASAAGRIKGSRKLGAWLNRALGGMFIALGIRLAISQQ